MQCFRSPAVHILESALKSERWEAEGGGRPEARGERREAEGRREARREGGGRREGGSEYAVYVLRENRRHRHRQKETQREVQRDNKLSATT